MTDKMLRISEYPWTTTEANALLEQVRAQAEKLRQRAHDHMDAAGELFRDADALDGGPPTGGTES